MNLILAQRRSHTVSGSLCRSITNAWDFGTAKDDVIVYFPTGDILGDRSLSAKL